MAKANNNPNINCMLIYLFIIEVFSLLFNESIRIGIPEYLFIIVLL